MKTAIVASLTIFALAVVISMGVALLIKILYVVVRRINGSK